MEQNDIVFPKNGLSIQPNKHEEIILGELMYLTDLYRLHSRRSLTEFLTRVFLVLDVPLPSIVNHYFTHGSIVELTSNAGTIALNLEQIKRWIGVTRKLPGDFDFIGTTAEFLQGQNEWIVPITIRTPIRKNMTMLSNKAITDAYTVAEFFTDKIANESFPQNMFVSNDQYAREEIDCTCFEMRRHILFNPLKELNKPTIEAIRLKIGAPKLRAAYLFSDSSEDERLAEIVRIAYGIKNGYILPMGSLENYTKQVDPYFYFSPLPIMDVFLKANSFLDLYHYFSMYEWMDRLPAN
jgi:hypothetical protein